MPDTDPSSTLAGIRERYTHTRAPITGNSVTTLFASASDVPPLVAALEAVLALAGKLEPQAPSSSALEEDRMWVRQECADMIREAITTALTGEETQSG